MHHATHFAQQDPQALAEVIQRFPLATLIMPSLDAHHVPMLLQGSLAEGTAVLHGHVARANSVWQREEKGDALAIFHGPQAYITPSWYASKAEHGKVVPTWNYVVVHVRGTMTWIDDAAWKLDLVTRLTQQQEADQSHPWQVSDAPTEFIDKLSSAIVGFEIRVSSMVGQFKLSQNRSAADRAGVKAGLAEQSPALAMQIQP